MNRLLIFLNCFRLAEIEDRNPRLQRVENFEILSSIGMLSQKGLHIHIGVADSTGKTFGGHLFEENELYYYVELIIAKIKDVKYRRVRNRIPLDSEDEETFYVVQPVD